MTNDAHHSEETTIDRFPLLPILNTSNTVSCQGFELFVISWNIYFHSTVVCSCIVIVDCIVCMLLFVIHFIVEYSSQKLEHDSVDFSEFYHQM